MTFIVCIEIYGAICAVKISVVILKKQLIVLEPICLFSKKKLRKNKAQYAQSSNLTKCKTILGRK